MSRTESDHTGRSDRASSDRELLRRVAARDRIAFEQLYIAYHRRLTRFLGRFADRYGLIEEIVNDTLYVVWEKADEFRGDAQVGTWIMGIAYRRALKTLRHLETAHRIEAQSSEPAEALFDELFVELESREQRAWIARGLARLPLEQRMALELCYYLGHSCEEIAEIAGCPVNTVKTRLFNARVRLRELLPRLAEPVRGGGV